MKSSNLRAHAVFLAILLVFCYFVGQSATADTNSLPESVIELLSGKTTDVTGVANQIPEHQLPTALAAAKLLKFRALHGETSLSSNEAESFETILLDRMSTARQVAFSQNETCRKKVEQREIMFDGQKLLVPAHFVADAALAIIDCRPKGEAGSLFPDFSIEVFSQSQLTEVTLAINGQKVNTKNILIKQSANAFELSYRTPATPDSLLAIGTHTAEITINNQAGETTKQEWLFTVGVHDTSTLPLTADAVIISEIDLPLEKILPGVKALGQLTVVVYQNAAGTRFTEYRFKTATGQTIASQNLAFIARKITAGRDDIDKLSFSPQTHYAFAGNLLNFSYTYSGSGDVISEKWLVSSGGHSTTEPVITMNGGAVAECTITVQKKSTNSAGEEVVYQYDVVGIKYVSQVKFRKIDIYSADPHLQHAASCSFAIENTVISNISDVALVEGGQYTASFDKTEASSNAGVLTVDKLSWHIHASEGSPKIENPSATSTRLISNVPGCAELVLDIKLTWQEAGETYTSDFKPSVSALFANYPITAKAEFSKYPPGIIYLTSRHIALKSFEFSIKNQRRLIANPGDCELTNPILICQSSLWPASAPIVINKALPMLSHGNKKEWLEEISPFTFQTPEAEENVSELPLCLGGHFQAAGYFTDKVIISDLPSVPIFSWDDNLLSLNLDPAGPVTTYEGAVTTFSAEVEPSPEMGSGILSATDNTLDLLDGYKVESVVGIGWYEAPLDSDDDWKTKAASGQDYSHIFNPEDGPGSYTMNCTALMKMQESDTADSFMISAQNNAPVDVLPGLRIFSPINELAYPLDASLKVKTSFDKDPKIWNTITWYLNGKEYKHGLKEPPFFIKLDHTGKWTLQAELTIENPQTGEDMLLKDRVDFMVNPVEISLTPARKVFDFNLQQSQELALNITLNGKKVEKPGKPVEWSNDGLKAVVDPIEWFSAKQPNDCATINHDEDSLTAKAGFAKAGAATLLATITVRLTDGEEYFRRRHKYFEDEFEEPVFSFPFVRADLWAITVGEMRNIEGIFPERAITGIERTFKVHSFAFDCLNKEYRYSSQVEQPLAITLEPALKGGTPVKSTCISFTWSAKDHDRASAKDENIFKFIPEKDGQYQVSFISYLNLDSNDKFSLGEKKYNILSVPFDSLIHGSVDPSSFTLSLGEPQNLICKIWSDDTPQLLLTNAKDQTLTVFNGAYEVNILKVAWTENADSSKQIVEASTYNFVAMTPGLTKGAAIVDFAVVEIIGDQKRIAKGGLQKRFEFFAHVNDLEVKILANGELITDQEFYQGQKIDLTYSVSLPDHDKTLRGVKWSFEGDLPLSKIETKSDQIPGGSILLYAYKVLPLKEDDLEQQKLELFLFDYNPDKSAVVGTFSYTIINEQPREKGFVIPYSKVMVEGFKPENSLDDIQIFEPEPATWAIGFPLTPTSPLGAFEAQAAFINETPQLYRVGGFQLVRVDAVRSFVDAGNNVRKQFLKTIDESVAYSNDAEFWLDGFYPAQSNWFNKFAFPHDTTTFFQIIQDNPKLPLTKKMNFDGVTFQAATLTVEMTFHTFLFAKPDDKDFSYHSFIIPLQAYESGWKTTTSYDKKTDKWTEPDGQVYRFKEIELPILEWKNLALGKAGGANQSPNWRDLKE